MNQRGRVVGALCFVLLIQFFVLHVVVESAWTTPYSWAANAISDLGTRRSPLHTAMNLSFVVNGLCIAAGGLLLGQAVAGDLSRGGRRLARAAAFSLALAGVGTVLVGLNPGDLRVTPHLLGAFAATIFGNAGVLLLGLSMRRAHRSGWAAGVGGGVLGFAGSVVTGLHLLGALPGQHEWGGAAERVAIFPMLLAMIAIGAAQLLRPHHRSARSLGHANAT